MDVLEYPHNYTTDITCNINDQCKIKCASFSACINIRLYCFGTCVLDCNGFYDDINDTVSILCPNEISGNYSFFQTTIAPSTLPTQIPTSLPSFYPSQPPTIEPSAEPTMPTISPTDVPGDTSMTTTQFIGNNSGISTIEKWGIFSCDTEDSDNKSRLDQIESFIQFIGLGLLLSLLIVLLMKVITPKLQKFQGGDKIKFTNIIAYIHSAFDFWTDLSFCYLLYLRCYLKLFVFAFIFTMASFVVSLIFIVYWIYKWRLMTTQQLQRIRDYLKQYSVVLILLTVFGDFYSAVLLVRSKLFYADVFNFSLKESEMDQLIVFKFINITLLEVLFFYLNCFKFFMCYICFIFLGLNLF